MTTCRVLCTSSYLAGARIMEWGLEEPAVHVALHFPMANLVYHSNFLGVHTQHELTFFSRNEVIAIHEIHSSDPPLFFDRITDIIKPAPYDFGAFAYFLWRVALRKFFGKPLPDRNRWQTHEGILCTEMLKKLNETCFFVDGKWLFPRHLDLSMKTPWEMITLIQKQSSDTIV